MAEHGNRHRHEHVPAHGTATLRALSIALALTAAFAVVEAIAGWMAGSLAWERRLAELRSGDSEQVVDVRVEVRPEPVRAPLPEPISLREPERVPFGAPLMRVPRHDHRVA